MNWQKTALVVEGIAFLVFFVLLIFGGLAI